MAIVYSYPRTQPELQDLLIGTEMSEQGGEDIPKTRTFTIGSIINMATAAVAPDISGKEDVINKSSSTSLGTSDILYPTQNAVKTYVDNNVPVVQPVSATVTGVVNNISLQELGGVDKTINGVRVGRGNISDPISENTAFGYKALKSVVHTTGNTGYYNTAFGDSALTALISGEYNSAFGDWALIECTTGKYNIAIGTSALRKNNGEYNTGVGVYALGFNKGSYNTAIGFMAGGFNTTPSTGSWNILVGMQAGRDITSGSNNLLIENITNASVTSGSYNIVLNPKQKSGVKTGSYNTIIGCWDGAFPDAMLNNVILGDGQGNIRFRTTETGLTTVPGQTNALIDADTTGKAVVTKEYLSTKENSANKQNSLAVDGTGIKFPTVDAVNLALTNVQYWTKTGNDIQNNTTGGVVKVQGGTGLYYDNAFQTVQSNGVVGFSAQNGGNVTARYVSVDNLSAGFAGISSSGGLSVTSGGIRLPFVNKTSNYTLDKDYFINCNGTFNITLPEATAINLGMPPGRFYKIKNTGTGVITILTTASQTIDGALSYTLNPNCFIELTPNITQWLITSETALTIAQYWTKTGDNIQNNNIGNTQVKILTTKQFQLLDSTNTVVGYIDEKGIGRFGAGSTYTAFGPANANIHLSMVRTQMSANFTLGNPQISQPYTLASTNSFGTSYIAGSTEASASAVAEHSFNIGNSVGNGITSGIFRISRIRLQSTVPVKYATDLSTSYDDRTLVDKGYVNSIARPYKVYTALLSQSGTTAPVATVLENTLGFNLPLWSYNFPGDYSVYVPTLNTPNKIALFIGQTGWNDSTFHFYQQGTDLYLDTRNRLTNRADDLITLPVTIEIRVYN